MIKADTPPWITVMKDLVPCVIVGIGWIVVGVQTPWLGCLLFGVINGLLKSRHFKQGELCRQSAAAQTHLAVPLAISQLPSNAEVISEPWAIRSWPGWLFYALALPVAFGVVILFPLIAIHTPNPFSPPSHLVISLVLTTILTVEYPLSTSYQRIVVSEDAITVRRLFSSRSIRWTDVRLFAIDEKRSSIAPPLMYELSSATTIVRWVRETAPSARVWLDRPFEVYDHQMDALLLFIAAKTSLPLYDLRQPKEQPAAVNPLGEG